MATTVARGPTVFVGFFFFLTKTAITGNQTLLRYQAVHCLVQEWSEDQWEIKVTISYCGIPIFRTSRVPIIRRLEKSGVNLHCFNGEGESVLVWIILLLRVLRNWGSTVLFASLLEWSQWIQCYFPIFRYKRLLVPPLPKQYFLPVTSLRRYNTCQMKLQKYH